MKAVLALALLGIAAVYAADWAVIVAGSNGYYNYRHQADACHAYQIVNKGGISADHIIMLYFDDIANNAQNPVKGKLFNKPTAKGTPGVDVYNKCQKDYTGNDVTADTFMNVITGNKAGVKAGGKVLQSGPNDNVFIFFTDHGGTGIIAFPVGAYLTSQRLNDGLKQMFQKKMYNKLVFYMEACESGSMFENILPANMNIYVTTASNADESSWGCYCPPDDVVNGVEFGSCLGDLYSVNWMENTDSAGLNETLQTQFNVVKQLTTQSHVMQYGDISWTSQQIGAFLGDKKSIPLPKQKVEVDPIAARSAVESRDIPMHSKYYAYLRADKSDLSAQHAAAQELIDEVQNRMWADNLFLGLTMEIVGEQGYAAVFKMPAITPVTSFVCFDEVNAAFQQYCGGYDDYSLKYSRVAASLCNYTNQESEKIIAHLKTQCVA
jgi:legumain